MDVCSLPDGPSDAISDAQTHFAKSKLEIPADVDEASSTLCPPLSCSLNIPCRRLHYDARGFGGVACLPYSITILAIGWPPPAGDSRCDATFIAAMHRTAVDRSFGKVSVRACHDALLALSLATSELFHILWPSTCHDALSSRGLGRHRLSTGDDARIGASHHEHLDPEETGKRFGIRHPMISRIFDKDQRSRS